ncbi:hypothetical protein LARV_03346 [Longilinea arvoryzae]|uniref:YvlB/LiaX N-terminal domain-containing protein n=1 Tax=Longilinea arvoryzae TaxID=360412 RepID=A0A0S7BLK6_9CHLR|nr:hypothetical protein [Longilinea arvoryzae]GAP15555.1 hypothetical protein LARV_03346 [Longilinea arvoryzae]
MVQTEERLRVLKMLQEGKISATEAAQILEALEEIPSPSAPKTPASASIPSRPGKWFRVQVTDTNTGKTRVNVRLPLNMVSAGVKMGMKFSPEVEGLDVNELMAFINSGEVGQIVDVTDIEDGEHVEVFIE